MNPFSARMAMLLLVIGLFVSCTGTHTSIQPDQNIQKAIEGGRYKAALQYTSEAIQKDPQNARLYVDKGLILSKMAAAVTQPAQRTPVYQNMTRNLDKARELDQNGKGPLEPQIEDILTDAWGSEHNQGVSILSGDSAATRSDYQAAKAHLKNAVTIMPDSAISHAALSAANYKLGDIPDALESMKAAVVYSDSTNIGYIERLAYLYNISEQDSEALDTYRFLIRRNPGDLNLLNGMANVYLDEQAYDALSGLLKEMLRKDPDNSLYHQIYGRELYTRSLTQLKAVRKGYENGQSSADSLNDMEGKARKLFNQAIDEFSTAIKLDSTDVTTPYTLGLIYQNTGVAYLQISEDVRDTTQSSLYEKHAKDLLTKALPYLKRYAESPNASPENWHNLQNIYQYLGMTDKAQEASRHVTRHE